MGRWNRILEFEADVKSTTLRSSINPFPRSSNVKESRADVEARKPIRRLWRGCRNRELIDELRDSWAYQA